MSYKYFLFLMLVSICACNKYDNDRLIPVSKVNYDIADEPESDRVLNIRFVGNPVTKKYHAEFSNLHREDSAQFHLSFVLTEQVSGEKGSLEIYLPDKTARPGFFYMNSTPNTLKSNEVHVNCTLWPDKASGPVLYICTSEVPVNYLKYQAISNQYDLVSFNFNACDASSGNYNVVLNAKGNLKILK
ncbi:MAG: hypothetical protein JWM28_1685 [Chitinophagaceae bacterium]|nr:hypothetical protein [Chitinophagaceae bacterium]